MILEAVLAILLLGVVVGAMFNFLPMSVLTSEHSGHRLQAQALADSSLERLRSRPFTELLPATTTSTTRICEVDYAVTTEVFSVAGHDPSRVIGLRSLVEWSDRLGPGRVENEVWVSCIAH